MNKKELTHWENFYEVTWEAKFQHMRKIIDGGERHPLRVIRQLESYLRYNTVCMKNTVGIKDGSAVTIPNTQKHPVDNITTDPGKTFNIDSTDILPSGMEIKAVLPLGTTYYYSPYYYEKNIAAFLIDLLQDYSVDAIVELGSGYGQNLIKLFYGGGPRDIPYYAGEFTESGTNAAGLLASLTDEFTLVPFRFDHKEPDLSPIKEKGKIFVFTCHTIEQVQAIPSDWPKKIADHAHEVTCVHLEPFGFQITQMKQASSQVDAEHEDFFQKKGWNQNLFSVLANSHLRGEINLKYVGKNVFGGDRANPTSLAVWQKK